MKVDFMCLICNYFIEPGIYRDETMVDKLIYTSPINKITVDYNLWLKRLNTQLNEQTNKNLSPQS